MKKTEQHEKDHIPKDVVPDMNKDRSREIQVLERDIADDLDQLRGMVDQVWGVLSDQHEINQMLTDRLFILENENVHVSTSIH